MAASDATPFPLKNTAYRITFPILDGDGDLVAAAAALDSEVSKDGATFTDCTNEAVEIATSGGVYYLDLTSTEMNADTVAVKVQSDTTGAKTTTLVMYPAEDGDIRVDVVRISGNDTAAGNLETVCNNYSATRGLAGTALPNAAADSAGGLVISDDGNLDMDDLAINALGAHTSANANNAILGPASSSISAIEAVTDNLPDSGALNDLAAILADTNELQTDDIPSTVNAIKAKTDYLPSATAGATGGVFIAGTNAPVTITGSGTALTIASSGGNGKGIYVVGAGSGHGIDIESSSGIGVNIAGDSGIEILGSANAIYIEAGTKVVDIGAGTTSDLAAIIWDALTSEYTTADTFGEAITETLTDTEDIVTNIIRKGQAYTWTTDNGTKETTIDDS